MLRDEVGCTSNVDTVVHRHAQDFSFVHTIEQHDF